MALRLNRMALWPAAAHGRLLTSPVACSSLWGTGQRAHKHGASRVNQQRSQGSIVATPQARPLASSSPSGGSGASVTTPTGDASTPHVPVLMNEVLSVFQPLKVKVYVDGTLGAGGHASAVLKAHPEMQTLIGVDLDPAAHALAQARLRTQAGASGTQMYFAQGNYSGIGQLLKELPGGSLHGKVDAMLLDLGVSSMQLDTPSRGFSFMRNGPIDMRMDPGAKLSAEEVINTWSEAELGRIIREYGEEKQWRSVARRIVEAREVEPIRTTQQLAHAVGRTYLGKSKNGKQIHPATRTFQALRIAVNDELGMLEQALPAAVEALAPGGRLAVITFHGLEDRAVKRAFAFATGKPTAEEAHMTYGSAKFEFLEQLEARAVAQLVTRKALEPTEAEVAANPRSRSAKLRVIQKL